MKRSVTKAKRLSPYQNVRVVNRRLGPTSQFIQNEKWPRELLTSAMDLVGEHARVGFPTVSSDLDAH